MKYTTKQAEDILTLAQNYANNHSVEKEKTGCYIVSENLWRTVLSKGYNSSNESAEENAYRKVLDKDMLNGCSLFVTLFDKINYDIFNSGIKLLVYGGEEMPNEIKSEFSKKGIETVHIEMRKIDA